MCILGIIMSELCLWYFEGNPQPSLRTATKMARLVLTPWGSGTPGSVACSINMNGSIGIGDHGLEPDRPPTLGGALACLDFMAPLIRHSAAIRPTEARLGRSETGGGCHCGARLRPAQTCVSEVPLCPVDSCVSRVSPALS